MFSAQPWLRKLYLWSADNVAGLSSTSKPSSSPHISRTLISIVDCVTVSVVELYVSNTGLAKSSETIIHLLLITAVCILALFNPVIVNPLPLFSKLALGLEVSKSKKNSLLAILIIPIETDVEPPGVVHTWKDCLLS